MADRLRSDVAKAVMKQRAKEKRSNISLEEIQHITGRDPTYHWKRSNISLEEIQHITGRDPTYHWKRSNISLEEIQHITRRDPTYHWKRSNISLEERKALQTLCSDKMIKILLADKGRAMVIMKATEYDTKIAGLLGDGTIYKKLERDPTNVYKSKLVNTMKEWKRTKMISDALYYSIYPTSEAVPKFYGLPKVHKNNVPLIPMYR